MKAKLYLLGTQIAANPNATRLALFVGSFVMAIIAGGGTGSLFDTTPPGHGGSGG